MERSFELKLGQHFKIVHKLCFSLRILLNLGSKELFLVINILFIRYIFINRDLNTSTLSYLTQLCCGIILHLNLIVHHHF